MGFFTACFVMIIRSDDSIPIAVVQDGVEHEARNQDGLYLNVRQVDYCILPLVITGTLLC